MKKLTAVLLSALLVLSLAACGNSNQNTVEDTSAETESKAPTMESGDSSVESPGERMDSITDSAKTAEAGNSNILIAYFSVMETDGVDTVAGASRVAVNGEVLGNNEYIAQMIQRETGGDLFAIFQNHSDDLGIAAERNRYFRRSFYFPKQCIRSRE